MPHNFRKPQGELIQLGMRATIYIYNMTYTSTLYSSPVLSFSSLNDTLIIHHIQNAHIHLCFSLEQAVL
jgi:hypothetical protein